MSLAESYTCAVCESAQKLSFRVERGHAKIMDATKDEGRFLVGHLVCQWDNFALQNNIKEGGHLLHSLFLRDYSVL